MSETINAFDGIEVLKSFILFQFEDEIDASNHNAFLETTKSGIVLKSNTDLSVNMSRWGIVVAVGDEVDEEITVGTRILIDALKWTKVSTFNGEKFARTENDHVLAISD